MTDLDNIEQYAHVIRAYIVPQLIEHGLEEDDSCLVELELICDSLEDIVESLDPILGESE